MTKAMLNIGVMYRDGQGVAQDYAQAMQWFKKAAERACQRAQNRPVMGRQNRPF